MSEENVVPVVDDGSPPGHIEKMLGKTQPKGDESEVLGSTGDVPARPDEVPEKFWDAEKGEVNTAALLKSQQDGEAALRAKDGDDKEGNDDDNSGKEGDESTPSQGTVVDAASAEWAEKGELSESTFKSLEGAGLSRDMVNTYIAGQQSIIGNLQNAAYSPFEGQDGYDEAANWAAQNLSDDEIAGLDVQLTSTNPAIVKQGAKALAKVFKENADVEPSALRGNNNSSTTGATYASRAEMMKDMASSRYRTDAGFRREVALKLQRSKL